MRDIKSIFHIPLIALIPPISLVTDILHSCARRPLLCVALCWLAGVLLQTQIPFSFTVWALLGGAFLLVWGCALLLRAHYPALIAFGGVILFIAAGVAAWQSAPPMPADVRYLPQGGVMITGYTRSPATMQAAGWSTIFRLQQRRVGDSWIPAQGDIWLSGNDVPPLPGHQYQLLGQVLPAQDAGGPYAFDGQQFLTMRGCSYRMRLAEAKPLPAPAPAPLLGDLRQRCGLSLARVMTGEYPQLYAHLLEGIVLGVYGSPIPDQFTESFRRAGILHVMVVSGSQVALLAGLFLFPLLWLPFGRVRTSYPRLRYWLLLCSLPVLAVYILLADSGPSVDRAVWMVLFTVAAIWLALSRLGEYRSYHPDGLTLLAAALLVALMQRPAALFSPGLQLSFAAVFGLITVTPVIMRLLHRLPMLLQLPIAATLGAQLMTYPVQIWHFGVVTVLAPLTNIIAVPLVSIILPLGLLVMSVALVAPGLALPGCQLLAPLLHGLVYLSAAAARCPWATMSHPTHSLWEILLYLLLLSLLVRAISHWLDRNQQGWQVPAGREPKMW